MIARVRPLAPGLVLAAVAAAASFAVAALVPALPALTVAVLLGIIVAQIPALSGVLGGTARPGLAFAAKKFMRLGVVLLGLKLSLAQIAALGWGVLASTLAIVAATFVLTLGLARLLQLPGEQGLLVAAGFSICGASAIGAVAGATGAKERDQAVPVALVTLCGTLAIAVLPLLQGPLGLDAAEFGHWVGASVHDVGQVVATAQIAGSGALAIAIAVKLTRVLLLAPLVAGVSLVARRRSAGAPAGTRPPLVPLFVAGFLAMILVRSVLEVPDAVLHGADVAQSILLALALFGLGTAVRVRELLTTGWRALVVALGSWAIVAALGFGAVLLTR